MNAKCVISMKGHSTILRDLTTGKEQVFNYDYSFWSFDEESHPTPADQSTLQAELGSIVLNNAFEGYNTCLFAYGQTGSGKSYSMTGIPESPGIMPQSMEKLFARRAEMMAADPNLSMEVEVSYLEIYNEAVHDLLDNTPNVKETLRVRDHPKTGPYVEGLSKIAVESHSAVESLIESGNKVRCIAQTNMNATSSRSHAIFTVNFKQKVMGPDGKPTGEKSACINLVDLAGSERQKSTGATGDRLKEGSAINLSLSVLGRVIAVLAGPKSKQAFVPYRESTLTFLLKESLGGNSRSIMIAALSPADVNFEETESTLKFAERVKTIVTKPKINEEPSQRIIRELQEELEALKKQLADGGPAAQPSAGGLSEEDVKRMVAEQTAQIRERYEAQQKEKDAQLASLQAALRDSEQDMQKRLADMQSSLQEETAGLVGDLDKVKAQKTELRAQFSQETSGLEEREEQLKKELDAIRAEEGLTELQMNEKLGQKQLELQSVQEEMELRRNAFLEKMDSIRGESCSLKQALAEKEAQQQEQMRALKAEEEERRRELTAQLKDTKSSYDALNQSMQSEMASLQLQYQAKLSAKDSELEKLREEMLQRELLIKDMSTSWEEKKSHAEKVLNQQQSAMEDGAISFAELSQLAAACPNLPFLQNLSEDPMMSGTLVYFLQAEGPTVVGNSKASPPPRIALNGPGIQLRHCAFEVENGGADVYVTAFEGSRIFVKGSLCEEEKRVKLEHGDRIALSRGCMFRVQIPAGSSDFVASRESLEGMWDECQKELLGVSSEEVFHFVEGFKGYFLATGSSEQEAMHRVDRLFDSYMQAIREAEEANEISRGFNKGMEFSADLATNLRKKEVVVVFRVISSQVSGTLWSSNKFHRRLDVMREMWADYCADGVLDNVPPSDPFYDDDVMVKAVPAGTTVVGALGSNEVTPPVSESDLILLEAQVARKKRELAQLELAVSQTRQSLGLPPPLAAANASSAGTSSSSASSGGFPTGPSEEEMARLRDLEEKNQKLKKAYVVKRDQAQDLEKRVESLEEELNSCKKELQEWEERSQKSVGDVRKEAEEKLQNVKEKKRKLKKEQEEVQEKAKRLEEALSHAEDEKREAERVRAENLRHADKNEKLKHQVEVLMKDKMRMTQEISALERRLEAQSQLQELTRKVTELQSTHQHDTQRLESARRRQTELAEERDRERREKELKMQEAAEAAAAVAALQGKEKNKGSKDTNSTTPGKENSSCACVLQ